MANTLMFEVGIKQAVDGLDKVKKELDQFVTEYSKKMQIQVDIKNLEAFINALKSIGNGDQLKPLLTQVERLQNRLAAMNDKGQYLDMVRGEAAAAAEAVKLAEQQLNNMKKTGNVNLISNARTNLEQAQLEATRTAKVLASATEQFAKEEAKAASTTSDTKQKIDALGQSVADLHTKIGSGININLSGDFSKWALEVQNVTVSVRELVEQLQKMNTATTSAANNGNEALLAQAKTVEDLRTKLHSLYNDGMKMPKTEVSYKAIEESKNVEQQLAQEQAKFNEMLTRGASVAGSYAEAIQQLGQKYSLTAEQAQKLASIIANGNLERGNVQRGLGVGYNKAEDIVKTVEALQKLKQEENKPAAQGTPFDPTKLNTVIEQFATIQRQIQNILDLWERFRSMKGAGVIPATTITPTTPITAKIDLSAIDGTVKALKTAVDEMQRAVNGLGVAADTLSNHLKGIITPQAFNEIKTQAAEAKQQVDSLAKSVAGMTKQEEKKGSEAILADNLQRLKSAIKDVIAEQDRLNEAYGMARNQGMPQNAEIEQRINLLRLLIQSMQNLAITASDVTSKEAEMLSKSKAFSLIKFSGTDSQLFSKETTHLYSKKEIDGYIKSIDEFIKAEGRMAQSSGAATNTIAEIGTAISRAAERASQAGHSFSQTTAGIQNFAMNVETARLAYDKTLRGIADLESRISAGQKAGMDKDSINFMNGLKFRAQQFADVLKKILGDDMKGNPAYREFLSMSNSILTRPQMGNGLQALLGSDWKILLKSIGETFGMLTKFSGFNKSLTLDNTTLTNWLKGEEAVRRLDNALKDLNRQWAATNQEAKTPDLTAKYQAQVQAIESLKAQLKGAMTEEARMANKNGLTDLLGVGYKNAVGYDNTRLMQEMRAVSNEVTKAEQKQVKEAERFTKQSIKEYAESIRRAGVELTTLGIKIRQLEQTEARARQAGVDTSAIQARIAALKQEEEILKRIHGGDSSYGKAKDYIRSEAYQREIKLAQEANAITNKAANERERADNKDIKNLEIKEVNLRRYNAVLNDMEGIMNRLSKAEAKGIGLGLDTSRIGSSISQLSTFIDKALNMDMRNLGDNGFIRGLREEWNALKKVINDTAKEQENLNKLQERSNARQVKAQSAEYKAMQNDVKNARQEAERLVESREKFLRGQAASLSKIMVGGKDKLDTYQYEQVRDALRAIREELRQIETAKQRGGLSTQALLGIGGGAQDFSGLISTYQRFISGKQQAAAANTHLTATEQQLANAIKGSTDSMKGQNQVMSDLKTMATQYLGVWGAQGFLKNVIEIGGQLEMQRLSIGAILGDMAKATELFDRIKNLAIKSPFGVVELDQMTKQLSAYGFEYNELFDMTKRLADISAATGTSVDRLALALGHVRSEAALSGYTLRQFSMANIPLAKKLSEELTKVEGKLVSVADVRKRVRAKDIGYEQVLKVLKDLTDEGGMFYNAQEIMSESVKARFKNLKDSMDIMYGEIAESKVGGALKGVAQMLTTLTRHWQELGAVLVVGAGYWTINKLAMIATNKAMVQGNLTLGRFSASQLEMQATTGNLTRAQLLQAVATKKLAVADAEAAAAVLGLSRAQLQHVANTGKASTALNIATIATSKYTISQLRLLATMRSMNLGWVAQGWLLLTNGMKAAGVAAMGLLKALWPMLAISAIVEVIMSVKRESEQFADAANYVGQAARNMMKDIDNAMKSVSKHGKPIDTESLREAVNTMKEVLENNEFYTAQQQKQVDNADTLSKKYDILLKQMKEMKEEAEWQTNNEGLVEKILANTGKSVETNTAQNWNGQTGKYETVTSQTFGSRFFNNSLQENIEQVNKSNSSLQSAISLLAEYQNVIEAAIKKNNNFGLSLDGKTWQEKVRLIAESSQWDKFVASVEHAGSRFEGTAEKVKDASDKVVKDWKKITDDDVKAIRLTLMQEWGMTENDLNQFAKNNERTMRWLVDSIAKSLSKLGVAEAVIDDFKQKLLELFGVASSGKATKREPTEYEKQTDIGKRMMRNVLNYNKNNGKGGNGVTTVKEINEITGTGENVKTESEVVKTLKERAQKDHESMKDVGRIYGKTSEEYAKAKKKYEHSLNLAESNGIKESEILTGKYKDKTPKKGPDEAAKAVRERVRLIKEAADAYQYWRDKVGEKGAWQHVQEEFGDVLAKIGITAHNIEDVRQHLNNIPNTKEYKAIRDKKVKTEVDKEIAKENDQYRRKDFERDTEKFLSKTQIELDNLTRSWETFNSVRDATGNVQLAIELSGAQYAEGQTRNLADAIKAKIQKDFDAAGTVEIPFDINLSDEQIGDKIKAAMPKASEDQIKGLVEEYKKWRDLQRDVLKQDIDVFAKLVGGAKDYDSQIQKINDDYKKQIEALDEVAKRNPEKKQEVEKAKGAATAQANYETWKLSTQYINLMNNSLSMTRDEVENGINVAMQHQNELMKNGVISAQEYAQEMEKIRNIQSEWTKNSFFGTNTAWGAGIMGGLTGRKNYYQSQVRSADMERAGLLDLWSKRGLTRSEYERYNKAKKDSERGQKKIEDIDKFEGLTSSFDALAKAMDPVINLFNELGMTDIGNILSAGQNALQSAASTGIGAAVLFGEAAGPYGAAIGAGLSLVSSLFSGFDDALQKEIEASKQRQKEMENMSKNLETALDRSLAGVYGVGETAQGQKAMEDFNKSVDKYREEIRAREEYETKKAQAEKDLESAKKSGNMFDIIKANNKLASVENGEKMRNWGGGMSYLSPEAIDDIKKADETGKYYDMQRASMSLQRDELKHQIESEKDKKETDWGAVSDMEQQIKELDDQWRNFAKDMMKALYEIDVKDWASQFGDALYDAWKKGEDGAKAFKKKASEIIGNIAKNILVQRVIGSALEPVEDAIIKMMDKTSGELSEKDFSEQIGNLLTNSIGKIVPTVNAALDAVDIGLQKNGLPSLKENADSSLSSNIKGITENTADLLASYLNAIRADVSVNRMELVNIRENYLKDIKTQMISAAASLSNIESHTNAIMQSNATIAEKITSLDDNIQGLKYETWRVPTA